MFTELQQVSPIAASISGQLASVFVRDFEEGMVAFRKERDADTTALLREMAEYFLQFFTGPRNLYHELVRMVRQRNQSIAIVTTNYDLLLEQAITEAGSLIAYHGLPVPENNISLLKIHGSCNFLPEMGGARLRGVTFANNAVNVETQVKFELSRQAVRDFCRREDSLAPAIAVYAPGKPVLFSSQAVKDLQTVWLTMLEGASAVYIIGLRVVPSDEHIWTALATAKASVKYVGLEPETFLSWSRDTNRDNARVLAHTFEEALPKLRDELAAA